MDNENNESLYVDVAVVGAGLAGLAAARVVQRAGRSVVVLDGQAPGGRARTDARRGFLFNRGPHALYRGGCAEEVLGRLGVRPVGEPPGSPAYGLLGDRMAPLPSDATSLLRNPLLGWEPRSASLDSSDGCRAALADREPDVRAWRRRLPNGELFAEMLARVELLECARPVSDVIVSQMQPAGWCATSTADGSGWRALETGVDVRRARRHEWFATEATW